MTFQLLVLFLLLILSGFFSSAETALFSISRVKARHYGKSNRRADRLIYKMKEDPHRLLTTILIGNNLVNISAAAIATALSLQLFPGKALGVATGVMTFLILVFGEILPRSFATRNNLLLARFLIFPVYWCSLIFFPVIIFLNFIPKITGRIKRPPALTEEELLTFVEVVEEGGEIKEEEKELIHNIIEFDDTSASEIMTPRKDMFVLDVHDCIDLKAILQSGYSRIPIIEDSVDNIIGVLHVKDLFMHRAISDAPPDLRALMKKPYFVPENKKLASLMRQFKKRKQHLAVIVDEHGGVSGLITLEDVIEEIVGEISDETDKEEPHIVPLNENEWLVLGKTDIEEVNETLDMNIPDIKGYDTFSGYILDRIGKIPALQDEIPFDNFTVVVKKIEGNRILQYLVKRTESQAGKTSTP
ncbi:MAG: hemolysin family protein [Desulfobacterales bacterium]|jgi:CBS domain containing-hemolysin-like protein|nr:hemolysin family protein [Desulfobacterales bacterium]